MSYQASQNTRQAILDHLRAHPLKSANQIAIDINVSRNSVQSCVVFMLRRGEIEKHGKGMTTSYKAIAQTTISAREVVDEMQAKRQAKGIKAMSIVSGRKSTPGHYIQRGGNWQPTPGAGGQGAVRQKVGVVSCAEWA